MATITEVQEKLDKMANWVRSDFMVNRELLACKLPGAKAPWLLVALKGLP